MKKIIFLLPVCVLLMNSFSLSGSVKDETSILRPFNYGDVQLLTGDLQSKIQTTEEFYLNIPNDNILHGFRIRKGTEVYGKGLNKESWYERNVYHTFGQFLSGISRFYGATGDERCLEKVNALIDGWGETIDDGGYFFFTNSDPNPHYTYEKLVGGLVDNYLYCKNPKALTYLSKITDWAIENLDTTRILRGSKESIEWYTLSENLYRAYQLTGDKKYFNFAKFWEYPQYWNSVADRSIANTGGYHAYSHLNTFSGAAEAYKITKDDYYLRTIIAAYNFFRESQCFVTGGYGANEIVIYPSSQITDILKNTNCSFEVQCGSWAGFKLSKSLITFTGEAHFGDWIELLIINGVGASLPSKNDGSVFYYADYNPAGATKIYNPAQKWECCSGTRPQAMADIHNLIWFHNDKDLFLNLFIPSTLQWQGFQVSQKTLFPERNKTKIEFNGGKAKEFSFGFRKAEWLAANPIVEVNGQIVETSEQKGWIMIDRKWHDGDIVDIELPMKFRWETLPDREEYPKAIAYGPVTMIVESGNYDYPSSDIFTAKKNPVKGDGLVFRVEEHPELILRPFYTIDEGENYFMYIEQIPPVINIKKMGQWMGTICSQIGASLEFSFEGTGVIWRGSKFDDAAMVGVQIDDKEVDVVDMYDPNRDTPFLWVKKGLVKGKHKMKLTILPEKNQASKNHYINYSTFEAITE